ncbi:MAG: DUF4292 domain-containing protein [Flavobacterium sp.]|nr:MAG: DUF4292 domain-containing protein [Flavobacterium sp.]
MKKYIVLVLFAIALGSCKSKAVVAEKRAAGTLSADEIITSHYLTERDFSTLYIKADARYKDDDQTQNVTADIKIKKDEKILISVRFLGITMAKALITPKSVQYYEKINGKYFDGDYTTLSKWLGTDLDFYKVQNLLVGEALDDLKKGKYMASIEDKLYKLDAVEVGNNKSFYFEAGKFLLKKEEIEQPSTESRLTVEYTAHTQHPQALLPAEIIIRAVRQKGSADINIDYNSVTFNEELSFPYSVPDGYDRIFID